MTLAVGSSTAVGTCAATATGTGGGIQQTATVNLTIRCFPFAQQPDDYPGKQRTYTVTGRNERQGSGTVGLSVSGLPPKTTASFNPTSVTNSGSSTLTVNVGLQAPRGTRTLTITGTSRGLVQSTTTTLTIQ